MDRLRIVLVTRRFWPLVGGTERELANLAGELAVRGCRVTILTVRWNRNWSAEIDLRGARVVRLPHPPRRGWGTFRYTRQLVRWLTQHRHRLDVVYVSTLRHEAYAAVRALHGRVPVVLRAETAGRLGDCLWQIDATCGRRIKSECLKAAALVAPSWAVERDLKAAGYPRPRIHYLPRGVRIPPPRSANAKAAAQAALKQANPALTLPRRAPLAVCTARLHSGEALTSLLAAWKQIVARWPNARLWLLGGQTDRAVVEQQIKDMNVTGRVVQAGIFDDPADVLAAADLFVLPAAGPGTLPLLLEAMAAELPVVVQQSPEHRELIGDDEQGLSVPPGHSDALSAAIKRLLEEADLAARLGAAARCRATAEFSLATATDLHLTLFEGLAPRSPGVAGAVTATQDRP